MSNRQTPTFADFLRWLNKKSSYEYCGLTDCFVFYPPCSIPSRFLPVLEYSPFSSKVTVETFARRRVIRMAISRADYFQALCPEEDRPYKPRSSHHVYTYG